MTDTDDYRRPPIMRPPVERSDYQRPVSELKAQWDSHVRGIKTSMQQLSGDYSRRNAKANRGEI